MMLKAGFCALIAMTAATSAALADCRIMAFRFFPAQNDSVLTTGVSTKGGACGVYFWAGGSSHYSSGSIAARPGHGTLSEVSALRFRYKPSAGFKGVDRYGLRICGTTPAGSGCSTITFVITVE
jgi:hypothetical protein